jgi:hypothetical protein
VCVYIYTFVGGVEVADAGNITEELLMYEALSY